MDSNQLSNAGREISAAGALGRARVMCLKRMKINIFGRPRRLAPAINILKNVTFDREPCTTMIEWRRQIWRL
jgi:hypothetical protein